MKRPVGCNLCPAFETSFSFVPFEGPKDARVLVVGQGPGDVEAGLGSPFVGPSGAMFDKWLALAGLDRGQMRVGNAILCWTPATVRPAKGNRPPKVKEIEFCRTTHWAGEVAGHEVIVPIGVPAMKQFYGPKASERTAGSILRHESGAWLVGLLHPSAIMRGMWGMETAQVQSLMRVRKLLHGWQPPVYDFDNPPPNANIFPTLAEMRAWQAALSPSEPVVIDVENAGWVPRMLGLTAVDSLAHIAVHFRQEGGRPWVHCPACRGDRAGRAHACTEDQFDAVIEWLYDFLASGVPLIMHNGFHDIEMLEEVGFEIANYHADTIFQAHLAMPEARKRLEHVACVTSGIAGWKSRLEESKDQHWK